MRSGDGEVKKHKSSERETDQGSTLGIFIFKLFSINIFVILIKILINNKLGFPMVGANDLSDN